MAQQDKTDWYWNGELAGAVNNLYYDLINVDVVHVPYTTTNRNSSFFLQTRRAYVPSLKRDVNVNAHKWRDVVDVKCIRRDNCKKEEWEMYVLLANKWRTKIRIHRALIEWWCVQDFDWNRVTAHEFDASWCWAFQLFTTDYVRWKKQSPWDVMITLDESASFKSDEWIQINKYENWTTVGYFSDLNVENGTQRFMWPGEDEERPENWIAVWDYILVYKSRWSDNDWFAWQVRMITWMEWNKIMVDAPWQWFKVLEWEWDEVKWGWLSYAIFPDWGEVVWFTQWRNIYLVTYVDDTSFQRQQVYDQTWLSYTDILSVAEASWKIYILTDNWYVHYSNYDWYDKFFVQDDMFAWKDKNVVISYRDIILAMGNKHISVWVPDESNTYTTMYAQSNTVWLWSRYSYAEYDWDLVFISNDRRLLALWVASTAWRYMLQYEDVGDMINSKLSVLSPWDEIFIWNDWNDLRIFLQTKAKPYVSYSTRNADLTIEGADKQENSMTRIIKFDKQFRVWTEDWLYWILLQWNELWIYYWENWLYRRERWDKDIKWNITWPDWDGDEYPFETYISAYLIENESDWVWGSSSRLAGRPKLFHLAKLNRLITVLWPWVYTHDSKIQITSYVKWLGSVYEFPINGDANDWLWLITTKFSRKDFDEEEIEKMACMASVIQDSQKWYQPKCVDKRNASVQDIAQQQPWCDTYSELLTLERWVCIDDSIYELAPSMPFTTNLGEWQAYATQIKIELIWCSGDIITFWGWLWEMFIAPLFTTGPDWEYQLAPNTDC